MRYETGRSKKMGQGKRVRLKERGGKFGSSGSFGAVQQSGFDGLGEVKSAICLGVGSALLLFAVSGLCSSQNPLQKAENGVYSLQFSKGEETPLLQVPEVKEFATKTPDIVVGWDEAQEVKLLRDDGSVEVISLKDYLWGVIAAEMPASFPLEALKAQAVAARTYTLLRLANPVAKHGEAQICEDSGCCQAYIDVGKRFESWGTDGAMYEQKIKQAVSETEGLCVFYEESPIDAVFFSSTSGQTMDALEVWGKSLPYLQSVESPEGEEVPNFVSETVISSEVLKEKLENAYFSMSLGEDVSLWLTGREEFSGGSVAQYNVGGITLTGTQIRAVLGLRSTTFTVDVVGEDFVFTTMGYGHGVGMSQYGAKSLAEEGFGFHEILTWYYTDTEVKGVSAE